MKKNDNQYPLILRLFVESSIVYEQNNPLG